MPEEKWFVTTKKADFNHIAAEFGISWQGSYGTGT